MSALKDEDAPKFIREFGAVNPTYSVAKFKSEFGYIFMRKPTSSEITVFQESQHTAPQISIETAGVPEDMALFTRVFARRYPNYEPSEYASQVHDIFERKLLPAEVILFQLYQQASDQNENPSPTADAFLATSGIPPEISTFIRQYVAVRRTTRTSLFSAEFRGVVGRTVTAAEMTYFLLAEQAALATGGSSSPPEIDTSGIPHNASRFLHELAAALPRLSGEVVGKEFFAVFERKPTLSEFILFKQFQKTVQESKNSSSSVPQEIPALVIPSGISEDVFAFIVQYFLVRSTYLPSALSRDFLVVFGRRMTLPETILHLHLVHTKRVGGANSVPPQPAVDFSKIPTNESAFIQEYAKKHSKSTMQFFFFDFTESFNQKPSFPKVMLFLQGMQTETDREDDENDQDEQSPLPPL